MAVPPTPFRLRAIALQSSSAKAAMAAAAGRAGPLKEGEDSVKNWQR